MAANTGERVVTPPIPSSLMCSTLSSDYPSSPSSASYLFYSSSPSVYSRRAEGFHCMSRRGVLLPWLTFLCVLFGCLQQASSQRCIRFSDINLSPPPARYVFDKTYQRELSLTLDTSQRLSHRISTAIFKIFLEEGLGYQNVSVRHYVEDTFDSHTALKRLMMRDERHSGPLAMINVEVWLPPNAIGEDIFPRVDCGSHATGSRFGWYVSKMNHGSSDEVITDHWRSFKHLEVAEMFALNDTENAVLRQLYTKNHNNGYFCNAEYCEEGIFTPELCRSQPLCAVLLVGDHYSFSDFLVEQVVQEELYVKIAWIGPNLTPDFFCHFRASKPKTFFDWYPNSLSNLDTFMPISFPPSSCCHGRHSPYLYYYDRHSMKKLIWDELPESADTAVQAVKRFSLQEWDYHDLFSRYNARITSCHSNAPRVTNTEDIIQDVACEWLQETKHHGVDVWKNWLPDQYAEKTVLWLAGIFPSIDGLGIFPMPQGGASVVTSGTLPNAAQMAISRINSNKDLLQDYEIQLMIQAGRCKTEDVMASFINYITLDANSSKYAFEKMIGILGPACSDTVEPLVGLANRFETVVLSYSAEGAIFDEHEKYPSFFRTIPENKMYGSVYLELFKLFEWRQVASLAEHCNKYSEYLKLLDKMLPKDITLGNFRFPRTATRNMTEQLMKLKDKTYRIIIGDFYANTARKVFCEAYLLNMTAKHDYVWFLPRWFDENWYEVEPDDNLPCNNSMMLEAIDRHMSLGYAYYAPLDSIYHEGISVREWQELYIENYGNRSQMPADYAGYTYDAVWTYAFALDRLLREDKSHVGNLHSRNTHKRFVELLRETEFDGVSGNIQFNSGRVINIMQFVVNNLGTSGEYVKIGHFDPANDGSNNGRLTLDKLETKFFHGIPTDGIVPQACLFQAFTDVLGVSCDIAIVIVMVLIFTVFAVILVALFFVYKKKFEKIPEQPVWPLAELCSLDKWELPREKIVINRTLGEGVFGTVYGGECQFEEVAQWTAVAVKTLKVGSTVEEKLDFLGEAEMMKRFNHKNIVQLLGLCTHQEPLYLIMEFMLYGDLKTYLLARRHLASDKTQQTEEDEVSSKRLTSMALDACRALTYLAEHRYVHRDIACRNCLVSAERVVKLSDFGMTRPIYESEYYRFNRRGMMPIRWMSPEAIEDGLFTNMSDMWSFGVLLFEIITFGSFPFQGMNNNQVLEHVSKGGSITIPNGVKPQLERILRSCWSKDPQKRPSFHEMLEHLTMWPRLITPCVGVPSASIQMGDTDTVEIVRAPCDPLCRRGSVPNARNPNSIQLNNLTSVGKSTAVANAATLNSPSSENSPNWDCNIPVYVNGCGSSVEPLLPKNGMSLITPLSRFMEKKAPKKQLNLQIPNSNKSAVAFKDK